MLRLGEYHDIIINRMKILGYEADAEGMCFGISHMIKQAILSNDWQRFNKRLQILANIPENQFRQQFEGLKQSWIDLLKNIKEKSIIAFNTMSHENRMRFENNPDVRTAIINLSHNAALSIDELNIKKEQMLINLFIQMKIDHSFKSLPESSQLILEIPAFFEGVKLYQHLHKHFDLIDVKDKKPQDAALTSSIVVPKKIDRPVNKCDAFSGMYSNNDLIL